jgi:hypothetical protein
VPPGPWGAALATHWIWDWLGIAPPQAPWQSPLVAHSRRYLHIRNATNKTLLVHIRYRTQNDRGEWQWYPVASASQQALIRTLPPGQTTDLLHADWRVNASRVRIWAESTDGLYRVYGFRDQDCWLVTPNAQGERVYHAATMQTYTVIFPPSPSVVSTGR